MNYSVFMDSLSHNFYCELHGRCESDNFRMIYIEIGLQQVTIVSNAYILAEDHNRYSGLVRGQRFKNHNNWKNLNSV